MSGWKTSGGNTPQQFSMLLSDFQHLKRHLLPKVTLPSSSQSFAYSALQRSNVFVWRRSTIPRFDLPQTIVYSMLPQPLDIAAWRTPQNGWMFDHQSRGQPWVPWPQGCAEKSLLPQWSLYWGLPQTQVLARGRYLPYPSTCGNSRMPTVDGAMQKREGRRPGLTKDHACSQSRGGVHHCVCIVIFHVAEVSNCHNHVCVYICYEYVVLSVYLASPQSYFSHGKETPNLYCSHQHTKFCSVSQL